VNRKSVDNGDAHILFYKRVINTQTMQTFAICTRKRRRRRRQTFCSAFKQSLEAPLSKYNRTNSNPQNVDSAPYLQRARAISSRRRQPRHQRPQRAHAACSTASASPSIEVALLGDGSGAHCILNMDISIVGVRSAPLRTQLASMVAWARNAVRSSKAARALPPTMYGVPTIDLTG